jgi:two-component system sensor histidine kinase DegS
VCIKIEDDGIGFEKDVLAHKYDSGIGISIMEERTYLLNGKFEINSKLNKGTEIIAEIPVVF